MMVWGPSADNLQVYINGYIQNFCSESFPEISLTNAKRALCMCVHSVVSNFGPMDCSPPGSSAHGIFQKEYWSRLPFPSPKALPDPEMAPASLASPALAGGFFTTSATWEAQKEHQALANLKLLVYLSFKASE